MREALFLAYIAALLLACKFVARMPPLQLVTSPGFLAFLNFSILLFGIGAGAMLPEVIAEAAASLNRAPVWRPSSDIGALGRLAQLVGAVCGGWLAIRGLWLWTVLSLCVGALYAAFAVIDWLLNAVAR